MVFFQRNGGAEVKMQFSLCDLQWLDTRSERRSRISGSGCNCTHKTLTSDTTEYRIHLRVEVVVLEV